MSITEIRLNKQVFLVCGTKVSDCKYIASNVYDNKRHNISDVIEAFNLWHVIENLTLEQILKDEKVQE